MNVQFLSKEIQSRIRSGITINTLVDCVEALVQNAIDSDANCIAVRVDLPFYKIQVIDNGLGIAKLDFELVGERYATSKCHCLGDLGNSKYYGYRGEALASLCEISQEVTIVSRTELEDKTFAKTFRGARRRIDGAMRRPSCGTTVTISGFLYNLPVRQAAIGGAMELERVRRSLESLAISNPAVSLSLRDDSSDAWCFRVPKTDSVVTTFSHIFGSTWASILKPVFGSSPPFLISGFFSLKGHRNKNLQFLYVHRRRILNHRLGEVINQLYGSLAGCNACGTFSSPPQRGSEASEKYPVFVLKIECPVEFYDVGFHPSKTVVEFKKVDVLVDLLKSTLTAFLSKTMETTVLSTPQQDDSQNSKDLLDVGTGDTTKITAQNYRHSLHSLVAKRPHQPEAGVEAEVSCKRINETAMCVDLKKASITPSRTPEANLKSTSPSLEESDRLHIEHLPAEGFGPFSNLSPGLQQPIHLSPALDHKRAALGRFIDVKKRQERIDKAIADLKRFSHKIQHPERSPHVHFLDMVVNHEIHSRQDESQSQISIDLRNVPVKNQLAEHECSSRQYPKSSRIGTRNTALTAVNHFPKPKTDVLLAEPAIKASTNTFGTNVCHINTSNTDQWIKIRERDSIFFNHGITPDVILRQQPSSTCASGNSYVPESNKQTVDQLTLENSRRSDSLVLSTTDLTVPESPENQEIEKSTGCSENAFSVHVSPPKIHCLGSSDAQPSESTISDLEVPLLNEGREDSSGQKRQWFLGTEPSGNREIFINGETGHSYYGRPPADLTTSLTATLVAGHPLPLDTDIGDNRLATSVLPVRPWRSRMPESGVTTSAGEEEQSVKKMLQMWENPVFKVDPMLKQSMFGELADTSKSYVFNKDIFDSITVIAQVDRKFIVCSVHRDNRLLVAFDQHAVHERIRLEELIREAENHESSERLKTTKLDPPLTLHLLSRVARVCLSHQLELISKGIEISACNDTDGDHTPVCISQVPICLLETDKTGVEQPTLEASMIENLLCELVETLEETGTFGTDVPKVILDALKSQACHGAIKFGDPLSVATCQNMIRTLGQCKLPFFCAHGRPSIVPLFDYNLMGNKDVEVSKPNLRKLVRK